jgi:tRNA(Ser,Leu) C12 N-acetylase TAN1
MGSLLITVDYGKEANARLEALDCIFPKDPDATCSPLPYGGLLLLETVLPSDEAAGQIGHGHTSLIFRVIPLDCKVESSLQIISSEVLRLVPPEAERVAINCVRRGRVLPSSHAVEKAIGGLLKERGKTIDLRNPASVIRIDIIGSLTTISVRPPPGFIAKKDGKAHG